MNKKYIIIGLVIIFLLLGCNITAVLAGENKTKTIYHFNDESVDDSYYAEDVEVAISINIEKKNNLTVNNPTESKRSEVAVFEINTNCDASITFKSEGIQDEDRNRYNEFFKYIIDNSSFDDNPFEFSAGSDFNKDIKLGNYTGKLSIEYFIPDDSDWYEIEAGEYQDTVVVTVSAN